MTTQPPAPQLALIALSEKATPGPWKVREGRNESQFFVQAPRIDPAHPYDIEILGEDDTLYPTRRADADFIVALVNHFRATQSRPEAELPEVVERVARAMHASENKTSGWTWEECSPIEIEGWRELAQAAIAAYGQQCAATRPAEVGGNRWLPIESAPEDGTPILIAAMEDGQLFDVLHGHFEVLAEDEEDGPWDIRDGEPWCSYEGRTAGIYFCHWLPGKEWEPRWKFGPNTGYTHWQPAPPAPGSEPDALQHKHEMGPPKSGSEAKS